MRIRHFQWFLAALVLLSFASNARAQDWQLLSEDFGRGYATCLPEDDGFACLALICKEEEWSGYDLALVLTQPGQGLPGYALVQLDGGELTEVLVNEGRDAEGQYTLSINSSGFGAVTLMDLARGQRLNVIAERSRLFSLAGFREAFVNVAGYCANTSVGPKSLEELEAEAALLNDQLQSNGGFVRDDNWAWSKIAAWRAVGPVLASGRQNRDQCLMSCLGLADCKAAVVTHDDACNLLSTVEHFERDPGADSVIISPRPNQSRAPAIPGDPPREAVGLRWQENDTVAAYLYRLRSTAASLGNDCGVEAAAVDALTRGFALRTFPATATAGEAAVIGWKTDAPLTLRVPAWVVVTSDRPVRFEGEGFFALLPGAIGPFGLDFSSNRHRAFMPLFEGEDISQGSFDIVPLEAAPHQIDVAIVAWHRLCQQERIAAHSQFALEVKAADPEIVVQDPTASRVWHSLVTIPEFHRELLMTEGRILLRDSRDQTEILSRGARDARLSPTRRYLILQDDGSDGQNRYEIIDVLDGKTILDLSGSSPLWWNADSYMMTNSVPYGRIVVYALALGRAVTPEVETAGACCSNSGDTRIQVDLENALVIIRDEVFSLIAPRALGGAHIFDREQEGLFDWSGISGAYALSPFQKVGTVAPIETDKLWNLPMGPLTVYPYDEGQYSKVTIHFVPQPTTTPVDTEREVMLALNTLPSTLRGISAEQGTWPQLDMGLASAIARWGVSLAPETGPEVFTAPSASDRQPGDARIIELRNRVLADLALSGHFADWSTVEEHIAETFDADQKDSPANFAYCNYSPQMDDIEKRLSPEARAGLLTEADLDLGLRFQLSGGRLVWVLRSDCWGGNTAGSITTVTSLNIFDSAYAEPNLAMHRVDSMSTMAANDRRGGVALYSTDFQAKIAAERFVLTYAPGKGIIMVYDLATRRFLLREGAAWKGDMLREVFVDADLRALFQLNDDGSFVVYRLPPEGIDRIIATAAPDLYGLYLDDELVVWTRDFRFDATEEGASYVEMRFPGAAGEYGLDQLGEARRIPDLLQKILAGSSFDEAVAPRPPPQIDGKLMREDGRLVGTIVWPGETRPSALHVFFDAREVARVAVDAEAPSAQLVLELPPGVRWASVVAVDAQGQFSRPVAMDLGPDPLGQLPRMHFMGVGIDRYGDARLTTLNYAKSDVLKVSDALAAQHGRTLELVTKEILVDRRATRAAVLDLARSIVGAAQPGDHVVLHVAGHGLRDAAGVFYLAGPETDLDDLAATALSWDDFAKVFEGRDLRVTVLLDACHAGSAALAYNEGAVEALRARIPAGMTVIAAAKGRQTSGEDASVGGGYFSMAAVAVIGPERARYDTNGNGILEAVEFYRGVKNIVSGARGAAQTPWLARNQAVGENGLF